MRVSGLSATSRRIFLALGVAVLCASMSVEARRAAQDNDDLLFKQGGTAVIFNIIKEDKAAEWEAGWKEIKKLLSENAKPELKEQGESIKILKIEAPAAPAAMPDGSQVKAFTYLMLLEKVSTTQSYAPTKIIYFSGILADRPAQDALWGKLKDGYVTLNRAYLNNVTGGS